MNASPDVAGYDVIGDVHGSGALLERLLDTMGYRRRHGVWRHPGGRTAVFVGDIIDRGPEQRRSVEVTRSMVEVGSAMMVIGNHEFNAIAYATPVTGNPDEYRRSHSDKHTHQHAAFLAEYEFGGADHAELIAWFRTLPMWLDLGGLRVIHACWSDTHIETLRAACGGDTLGDDAPVHAGKGHELDDAIEVVLKGPEVPLPEPMWYLDKDGHLRRHARFAWWREGPLTLRDRAVFIDGCTLVNGDPHPGFDDTPIENPPSHELSGAPVIVGHYWCKGAPTLLSAGAACVDYSAVKTGTLVAYRWSGETELTTANFIGCT